MFIMCIKIYQFYKIINIILSYKQLHFEASWAHTSMYFIVATSAHFWSSSFAFLYEINPSAITPNTGAVTIQTIPPTVKAAGDAILAITELALNVMLVEPIVVTIPPATPADILFLCLYSIEFIPKA